MRPREEINKDLRALMKCVTGLHATDENFKLCVDFAESNVRYHRFLSPDSHKIQRSIDGLSEKFAVHSQLSKAQDLKDLAAQFLEQVGLEGRDHGKTNTHYAILSMLVELAENPTCVSFKRTEHVEEEEEVDDFDWGHYLLENEDLNFYSYASSDSEGEELEDDAIGGEQERRVAWVEDIINDAERLDEEVLDRSESSVKTLMADRSFQGVKPTVVSNDYHHLEQSLAVEYWKGKGREEDARGSHSASNLAKDWNAYQQRTNEFHTPRANVFVTEAQLIRETLWMLSGIKDLFIFTHDKGQFALNPDIYLSHLTHESLSSFLQPLMTKATQVSSLQTFVKDIVSQTNTDSFIMEEEPVPQSYQAFADRLWLFLTDFKLAVKEEEQVLMAQEELLSLAKMSSDLRPWFIKLELLHSIFVRGVQVAADIPNINNAIRASLLLNTLYQVVHETDAVDSIEPGSTSELVMNLLIHSSRPLLDITSCWITNGQLADPMQEFVVQRNKEIKSPDETFWEKAFVSHVDFSLNSSEILQGETTKTNTSNKDETSKSRRKSRDRGDYKTAVDPKDLENLLQFSPIFLQPSLKDALVTGKSMEVLENLGRLGEVLPGQQDNYGRPPSLYELLLQDLNATFSLSRDTSDVVDENDVEKARHPTTKDLVVQNLLNAKGVKDTLLNINFAAIFPQKPVTGQETERKPDLRISAWSASSVLRHCENRLQAYVKSRYNIVCPRLVEILKLEYKLVDCIHAMQRYYLMSDGDIMTDFCSPIFDKIEGREYWQDTSILDMYLNEAISYRYPEDTERLRVEIVPLSQSQARGPINITDCIRLKYHVPWPVDVVISGKCEDRYNSIFSFLLQIKRSKSSLEQLRFEELSREQNMSSASLRSHLGVPQAEDEMDRATRIHRFHLLRFRLLYFVNSLHNYITTRILHSSGLEFAHRLDAATDLDQIISVHGSYVDIIYERCLLHSRLATLKDTVVQILNLSLTCSSHWHQGVDFIRGTFIQEVELKLTRCIDFLSSFLTNVIKRGSFPHLESLAVSLTSLQQLP